jgi:hypothetical protein
MKCQYCHQFGNTKEPVVRWHEKYCTSRPRNQQRQQPAQTLRPAEKINGGHAVSAELPIARNCWQEYLAQDHAPKIDFNAKNAGAAEFFDPRYTCDINPTSEYGERVRRDAKIKLYREFLSRAA